MLAAKSLWDCSHSLFSKVVIWHTPHIVDLWPFRAAETLILAPRLLCMRFKWISIPTSYYCIGIDSEWLVISCYLDGALMSSSLALTSCMQVPQLYHTFLQATTVLHGHCGTLASFLTRCTTVNQFHTCIKYHYTHNKLVCSWLAVNFYIFGTLDVFKKCTVLQSYTACSNGNP